MKMEKTPRYTQRERNMVLGFAAQYKDVIENKRTDAESNRKKDEVWRQIAKEFNCRVYHQRSSKQLRQLYKNMKLLLKKDLCGGSSIGSTSGIVGNGIGNGNSSESKSHRSFMDILNALSQQDSVAQYISEQLSPSGYSSSRQQKFDDEFDESKLPSASYDGLDNDVIVIKSEDISDNEHSSQNGAGCGDDMDDDDDDCLSPKDIPEVCLEEEDDEIFATDLRQPSIQQQQCLQQQTAQQQQQQQQTAQQSQQPEVTIQNVGGIRVGSIGSIANLANAAKTLLAASSSNNNNNNNNNNNSSSNNNNNNTTTTTTSSNNNNNSALNISLTTTSNNRATASAEQQQREQQQQLLFSGLGLSAVHAVNQQQLPTLQHATQRTTSHNNSNNHHANGLLALNSSNHYQQQHNHKSNNSHNNHHHYNKNAHNSNDYLMSLAIEERKRKIDLLNAQIEYWKTLTKKLDANSGHNPTPSCLCHFPPAKMNGLQSQQSSS